MNQEIRDFIIKVIGLGTYYTASLGAGFLLTFVFTHGRDIPSSRNFLVEPFSIASILSFVIVPLIVLAANVALNLLYIGAPMNLKEDLATYVGYPGFILFAGFFVLNLGSNFFLLFIYTFLWVLALYGIVKVGTVVVSNMRGGNSAAPSFSVDRGSLKR